VLTSSRATFEDQWREWANGDELTGNIVPDSWKGSNLVAEALLQGLLEGRLGRLRAQDVHDLGYEGVVWLMALASVYQELDGQCGAEVGALLFWFR
jgi:hypothetical protein